MAQDVRQYKSKEQDGQGNEIILRDQQLVEQGNATTMPSGACFETLDVDNRPVKIPRDNMMNIVLECIGIILNDSSKNLGTNVQKALGLQGNTIGHSTVADFASVLGAYTGGTIQGSEGWYRIARIGNEVEFSGVLTFSEGYGTTRGGCGIVAICTAYNSLTCSYIYKRTEGIIRTTKVRNVRENNNIYLEIYSTGGGAIAYGLFGHKVYQIFGTAMAGGGTVIHEVTIPT